ncbi:hypothetical protein M8C21_024886 [Ambrosia artemisiifolia]|uniref:Protein DETOXIFICATION n=1 Tax=Ambrosia artemisiifolia TaxID=4212 RepID=A0AAD5GRL0_AMBAR|nr:hypothetical protein M8C21_024886 [Ambrosia artemisiifolia]
MDDGMETKLLRHEEEEEGDLKQRIWVESKKIWRVALPGVISRVCAFGTLIVTQSFIGHISDIDLAGYALVQTLSVRFVNGILLGMSSATETLCGQAFGAGQHHMMGIYLQRSWIVDLITLTILLPVFIFGTQIYKLVGEEESIANSGGYISLWFIPFVYNFKNVTITYSAFRMDDGMETRLIQHEEEEGELTQRIWSESKKIWRVALPGVISRVSAFGTIVVTQSFIGHISDIDLAGYALVQTLSVRFINGILLGMSSATETLCGQAFGAGQHHMMGIYLQRSWIVDSITLTILLPILIFGTQIFKLLGEEEAIANSGGYISLWFITFVYNYVFSLTIQMYLQSQLKNMIIAWLSAIRFVIHIPLSMLFVYKLNMGVAGAMIALSMSSWILVIGEFIYIFGGWCPNSWKGFTVAAFKDLVPVVKLSISSGVMLCLELWYNAVLVLLAGYMENAEVAISAFSICLNLNAWDVRVANELGRGNARAVRFSIQVLLGTSMAIGVFFFVLCLLFGKKLAYLFTDDERVADTVSDLSLLLSFSVLLNSIYPILSGVAIGAGMQGTVAIVNLVCYYLIGIPLGALLGYKTSLQVKGIWIGMIGGVVAQTIALAYMTWRTNWDNEVMKASERLGRFYLKSDESSDQISN